MLDTGMHGMGWSRDKAVEFFKVNSPIEELNANVETDRYIAGQDKLVLIRWVN